ncbi:MAG: 16S rRNA (guanine(527)-N(7))-methyltransferase RsmG [Spirochaetales bacterium]|nr:16S rRNA (guanine(527)-N(7))-methyltransferase RsmG [Spirochaetales bacterium]
MTNQNRSNEELLNQGLVKLGLTEDQYPGLAEKLMTYQALVRDENERFGLVRLHEESDFVLKHVLDSLAPWQLLAGLPGVGQLVDLGSGAGLPGIPLALAFPQWQITLAERKEKRVKFLELAIDRLHLTNVKLWPYQIEELKERFPVAVFRAFSPLDAPLLKALKKLLTPQGFTVAYKGRREVLETEVLPVSRLLAHLQIVKLEVPFLDEERHAVIFQVR